MNCYSHGRPQKGKGGQNRHIYNRQFILIMKKGDTDTDNGHLTLP